MMKIFLCLVSFNLWYYLGETVQPYFPSQIVFSSNGGQTIIAIDEINQRAYTSLRYGASGLSTSYVMKHFPYAIPDSPQSKYYVQLLIDSEPFGCQYGTYWKYGGNVINLFPSHWWNNESSYEIKNYIQFQYMMIHSTNSSQDEDYWYANVTCRVDSGTEYPCEEIYFRKNTEIPLRLTSVVRRGWNVVQLTINYDVYSMGKPDEKYFDSIPQNWTKGCRDVTLGLFYYPQTVNITLHESVKVQIWLSTPPHRINGNDTVRIQWKSDQCKDCLKLSPEEIHFNGDNFQEKQALTITRVKAGSETKLIPNFFGGGFDVVPPVLYPIYIQ